jgi:hypothetical protein
MVGSSGMELDIGSPTRRSCGVMEVHRRFLSESAAYRQARGQIENLALVFAHGAFAAFRTGVIRIPVVVHVVWNTETQNVSDEQIQSQIDVLNQDFRRLNPDVSQVPAVWQSLVGDAQIKFFLAEEDENGNPTSGITRTQTTEVSFSSDDRVKSSATGGADPWPSDRYLNM